MIKDSISDLGSPDRCFFEQNALFKMLPNCRRMINSVGVDLAGKYAWAVVLLNHVKSPFHRLDDKHKIICEQYLGISEDEFDLSDVDMEDFAEEISVQCMTPVTYELSLNIDAIKKARKLVFDSTKSSDIMSYIEKTPKTISQLMALQVESNNTDKKVKDKKYAGAMATPSRPKKISEGDLDMSKIEDYD